MKIHALGKIVVLMAGLLAGLRFITLNVTGSDLSLFPGDFIDGRFNNYILEHCYLFFTGQTSDFWNAPFMFPEENVVTYSDNLIGSSPFYIVYRMFGASREDAFQLWFITVSTLNYLCCFLFLKFLFKNAYAAVCGALVFAFSMALHSQMGHAQTFPRYAIPLAFWLLLRFYEEPKPLYFFWALMMLAYQMYCGIYLGFLLAIPFGVFLAIMFFVKRKDFLSLVQSKRWLGRMALSFLGAILFLLPLLVPYLQRARQIGFYEFDKVLSTVPTFGSYFFSWKGSLCWDTLSETCIAYPAFWDHEIFSGGFAMAGFFISVILLILGMFFQKADWWALGDMRKRLLLLSGSITFILFLRVSDFSLYRIIYSIPGFGSMRALQRIINVELLFFAMGLAGLTHLITKKQGVTAFLITLLLVVAIVADNYVDPNFIHHKSKSESQVRFLPLIEKMKQLPASAIVSYEPDTLLSMAGDYQLDAMLAAQFLGLKTMNGYSATSPGGYGPYWVKPSEEGRRIWLERKVKAQVQITVIK